MLKYIFLVKNLTQLCFLFSSSQPCRAFSFSNLGYSSGIPDEIQIKKCALKDTVSLEIDSRRAPEEVESSPDGRVKVPWPWAE